ncbi:MAG: hypothetical protein ACRD1K_03870 [Acidimicrobiales bacterium]
MGEGADEYSDPVEFFRRTFLTEGLRQLLGQAVARLSGGGGRRWSTCSRSPRRGWPTWCAGAFHTLGLKGDGTVWAWGWNATGQLGTGTTVDRRRTTVVSGLSNATSVSAGLMHSAAVRVG